MSRVYHVVRRNQARAGTRRMHAICAVLLLLAARWSDALQSRALRPIPQAVVRPEDLWEGVENVAAQHMLRSGDGVELSSDIAGLQSGPVIRTTGEVLSVDPDFADSLDSALTEASSTEAFGDAASANAPPAPGTLAEPFPQAELRFYAIGDWGAENLQQRAVARGMELYADHSPPTAIISTGDNFYEFGVTSAHDTQWQTTFKDVYSAPALQVPWYVSLGNHDHYGSAKAQVEYSKRKLDRRWVLPDLNYTRTFPSRDGKPLVQLFVVDTVVLSINHAFNEAHTRGRRGFEDRMGAAGRFQRHLPSIQNRAAEQLRWLDAELGASRAPWKIVIGHYPVYSAGEHGGVAELVRDLLPLLRAHGVAAYLSGHDHSLQFLRAHDIDFLVSGSGSRLGQVRPVPYVTFSHATPGFLALEFGKRRFVTRAVDWNAQELASLQRTRPKRLK